MLLKISFSVLFVVGLWYLYHTAFTAPSRRVLSAVSKAKEYGMARQYEKNLILLSGKVERLIKISEYKRNEYVRMLAVLTIARTPEEHMARSVSKAALAFLGITAASILLPFILRFVHMENSRITPTLLLLAVVFAAVIFYSEQKDLKKKYLQHKMDIELELPKLCSVINSRLQSTSNVPAILTDFLPIANEAMSTELAATLTDMKTGNVETALRRFEGRISSPKVSDVVRGLIAVQNGDDMRVFFQSKQYQFNNDYITIKKKSIMSRPAKLTLPGVLAFAFFFAIVFYPMIVGMQKYTTEFI